MQAVPSVHFPFEVSFSQCAADLRRQIENQLHRPAAINSLVIDSSVPRDTLYLIPKIEGLCWDDEGMKVQEVDSDGNILVRELTDSEHRRFGCITNIGRQKMAFEAPPETGEFQLMLMHAPKYAKRRWAVVFYSFTRGAWYHPVIKWQTKSTALSIANALNAG